jgi:hypothetical protein
MIQNDYWARSDQEKADTFAEYLIRIFTPNAMEVGLGEEKTIFSHRESTQIQTT